MFDDTRKKGSKRETFLKGLKSSRVDREAEKKRRSAVTRIQSQVRRWISIKHTLRSFRDDLDVKIANIQLLKRTLEKAGKGSAFCVPKTIFLKLFQQFAFVHGCPVQWKEWKAEEKKDRGRFGSLAGLMSVDIEGRQCSYVNVPEDSTERPKLGHLLERFERILYTQAIPSLLNKEEETFGALYHCILAIQPSFGAPEFVQHSKPVIDDRWWKSQEHVLMQEFRGHLSGLGKNEGEPLTMWQRKAVLNVFSLACAVSSERLERGWMVTAVLSVPNLFHLVPVDSAVCQSSSFAHLMNDSLTLALRHSTYPKSGEEKVYVLANVQRYASCLQDIVLLKVCLNTILSYSSQLLLMVGKVYEGLDLLLWEETGRTKSATKLEERTKSDLRVLVEDKNFLKRSLEIAVNLDSNDKQLSAYRAHLEQRWEVIQEQLQQKTNVQPSLDPTSKSYLQAFTDLWQNGSLSRKITRSRSSKSKRGSSEAKILLRDTSDASRALAKGKGKPLLVSVAKVVSIFLSKVRPSPNNRWRQSMLNLLSFGCDNVVDTLWMTLQLSYPSALKGLESYDFVKWQEHEEAIHVLHVLSAVFNQQLMVVDDTELYDQHRPLHRASVQALTQFCKHFLFSGWTVATRKESGESRLGLHCLEEVTSLMMSLHERNSRRPLCKIDDWIVKELKGYSALEKLRLEDVTTFKTILSKIPYVVPFKTRVKVFRNWISLEKQSTQGEGKPKLQLTVHRQRMFQDGFQQLDRLRKLIRRRMYITFINEFGQREAGIDAGGLFKEFWTNLSKIVFNPEYGLFQCRTSNELSPNTDSAHLHSNHLELFEFVGLIVGKALYENIIIQPTFAHTFLSRLLGKVNHLHELAYYDADHYKSLLYIKCFQGSDKEFEDLSLSFSVTVERLGQYEEVDLVPNGRNIAVTKATRLKYVTRVGNYYLNLCTHWQTEAFRKGFFQCINPEWISIFSQPELQVLISGKQNSAFNLKDLKSHSRVVHSRSFSLDRIHVSRFWKIMEEFSDEERTRMLKFVTSCEREPLLGFAELDPPFTIQIVAIKSDKEKLPTASTCFNVLKLPTYSEKRVMKQKLLVAINSESGFEMS